MFAVDAKVEFDAKKLLQRAERGAMTGIVRSAAYLRGVAKRKVRRRKRGASLPGQPPIAHSGVFKASIQYGVDRQSLSAVVGPRRLATGRTNAAGQAIPHILEYGGTAALGRNSLWYHRRAPALKTRGAVAAYFLGLGYGPAYAAGSLGALASKAQKGGRGRSETAARGGKRQQYQRYKRFSPVQGKWVYLSNIRVTTEKQAAKVADTVISTFGFPVTTKPVRIAARPLMALSLRDSQGQLSKFFANTLK